MVLVLLVWLFWPEASQPKIDQRASWEEHLRATERQRARDLAEDQRAKERASRPDRPEPRQSRAAEPERRVLAKPSELADRVRWNDGASSANERLALPAAPVGREDIAAAALVAEARRAEAQAIADLRAKERQLAEDSQPDDLTDETEVAVYSSEALDSEAELEDGFDTALAIFPPDGEGFPIESAASAHVRERPRDDAPSWLKNAVASSLIDDRPVIAVVIDDLGLNRAGTQAMNDLPGPLTLAFLPYAGKIEAQTEAARRAGHELMVHLPMEPFGSQSPGPDALLTSLDHDEFVARLETNLNSIKGYVGVNNHMGSRLTSDRGRMDLVMKTLRERDVLFLDSKTSSRSVANEMADRNGVPSTTRDVFLDHEINLGKIRRQMALVERIARQTGSAVAIGHPHKATIEALRGWLPTLAKRGFAIAPISAVVARRACDENVLIAAQTCGRYLQVKKAGPSAATLVDG